MSARAGIVVTGTEVLTGRVSDRNGPWLADRLHELGVELALIVIVGDRPQDMSAAQADQELEASLPMLRDKLMECLGTDDAREGLTAFMQKREAKWTGK